VASPVYRIIDEPRPGPLAQIAVNPVWPFLSVMMAGGWLAWPWFALNAFAIGSARKRAEALTVLGATLAAGALALASSPSSATRSSRGPRYRTCCSRWSA